MSSDSFQALLAIVGPKTSKQPTRLSDSLSAAERLALTLPFHGTGHSQIFLSYAFRIDKSTVLIIFAGVPDQI